MSANWSKRKPINLDTSGELPARIANAIAVMEVATITGTPSEVQRFCNALDGLRKYFYEHWEQDRSWTQ